jgi:hypothetical protein
MEVEILEDQIRKISQVILLIRRRSYDRGHRLARIRRFMMLRYISIVRAPPELNASLAKCESLRRTIDSFEDEDIPQYFRFTNKDQLREVLERF